MIETSRLNALLDAPSIEALWDRHTRLMADYGFDRLIYGYSRYLTQTSLGDPDDFLMLTNHPASYTDTFIGKGLFRDAPMLRWVLSNTGACSWAELERMEADGELTDRERAVVAFNRDNDVTAGYTISFKSLSPRAKGAVSLAARSGMAQQDADAVWARHGDDILALNNVAHLKILSLPNASPSRALTPRQREVLGWVGDGKTVQDIATILDLTPATVEKHLRLARAALGVETTAQAVLKAAFQNQIFILDG
ncbi:LuxR family transcriptional regulator [Roseovarius salinarum]|uniref:LuxR family transcriptional regulator n=1 Tax=Roseovarius salinarum TaxID=1981892 RepID=UPI000C347406|nr:LuxR family transcriptional regulator [Roseovarius salinarum]